jgi:tetratricopeptide (TPR) repeat protein
MSWLGRLTGRREAATPPQAAAPDWKALGNTALAAGQLAEAARCYAQGAAAVPDDPALHLNLGFVLLEQGQPAAAAESLLQALALARPGDGLMHEAHYLLGRAHKLRGDPEAALARFDQAVGARADFAPAIEEAIGMLLQSQQHEAVLAWAQRWVQAQSTPASLLALAQSFYLLGRPDDARGPLEAILAADPHHAAALEGRGSVHLDQGRPREALADFDAALARGERAIRLLMGRAIALRRCERPAQALQVIDEVLAREPAHRDAHVERGGLLMELFRLRESEAALSHAIALFPDDADLRWARSTTRLLAGDMEGGWADYEVRHRAPAAGLKFAPPDYGVPHWTGAEDLQGRSILVIGEQGLGDTLQFVRYIPLLQERGARVTFNVLEAMHPLLQDALPGVTLVHGGQVEQPDFQCLLLSLPHAFKTTIATVPARIPYLRSRPELRAEWAQRLGPRQGLRVGIVWSGTTLFGTDSRRVRSIPLASLQSIAPEGVEFVSLQKEIRDSDRAALAAWPGLSHHGHALRSFADTAALADLVDLVISVDTSVAHLAGGLGRPLWVLLPYSADWRWMAEREDSPWYPGARLFRQASPGDWPGVLERVREQLHRLAQAPTEATGAP